VTHSARTWFCWTKFVSNVLMLSTYKSCWTRPDAQDMLLSGLWFGWAKIVLVWNKLWLSKEKKRCFALSSKLSVDRIKYFVVEPPLQVI